MEQVIQYAIYWRTEDNTGVINLALANGTGGSLYPDAPEEAMLLLDILRNEKPVYYDRRHALLGIAMEDVGEGEG